MTSLPLAHLATLVSVGLVGVIIAAFLCSETLGLAAILAVVGGYAALPQPPPAPSQVWAAACGSRRGALVRAYGPIRR